MSTPASSSPGPATRPEPGRPRRADAARNRDKILAAARAAFAEGGSATSLEAIARRAGVGIGTLYRNFSGRQALLEAVYIGEVQQLCRSARDLAAREPWEALSTWLQRVVAYIATKQALAGALTEYIDRDAAVFQDSRAAMYAAGEPLLARAQAAGEARADVTLEHVLQMVMGIAKMTLADPGTAEHVLSVALDGLRYGVTGAS